MSKVSRIVVVLSLVILAVLLISPVAAQPVQSGKLTPPVGFGGFAIDSQNISLGWKSSLPNVEVHIERAPLLISSARPNWTEIGVAFGTNSYTDSQLKCNSTYGYRARSFDPTTKTYSGYTKTLVITTATCTITPQP